MPERAPKHPRYQDYVIRDGRFVGEFEEMYRDHADPWHQKTIEGERALSDKAVALHLLSWLWERHYARRVVDIGCGIGTFTARIADADLDVVGIDIAPTAIERARSRHPHIQFEVGSVSDHSLIERLAPDVLVMSEITWYILPELAGFLEFMRRRLPRCYLLHLLSTYPNGAQAFGCEFFTDLSGIRGYFAERGLEIIESGAVQCHGGADERTWLLGHF